MNVNGISAEGDKGVNLSFFLVHPFCTGQYPRGTMLTIILCP
jgi:hypothetical protein